MYYYQYLYIMTPGRRAPPGPCCQAGRLGLTPIGLLHVVVGYSLAYHNVLDHITICIYIYICNIFVCIIVYYISYH